MNGSRDRKNYHARAAYNITTSGKSLMKITKNKGPNKEPWDTPDRMVLHIELIPSITTLQYRVKKNIGRKKKSLKRPMCILGGKFFGGKIRKVEVGYPKSKFRQSRKVLANIE